MRGRFSWTRLCKKYKINDHTVVVFFPESNKEWNSTALHYLPDFLKRKKTDHAIVFFSKENDIETITSFQLGSEFRCAQISTNQMKLLMDYYCLHRFSDKIVFFYLDYPKDNCSIKILEKTDVTMDELVCLGFYRLREVPSHV